MSLATFVFHRAAIIFCYLVISLDIHSSKGKRFMVKCIKSILTQSNKSDIISTDVYVTPNV